MRRTTPVRGFILAILAAACLGRQGLCQLQIDAVSTTVRSDVTFDGVVNVTDLLSVRNYMGHAVFIHDGESWIYDGYARIMDVVKDNLVNVADLTTVRNQLGQVSVCKAPPNGPVTEGQDVEFIVPPGSSVKLVIGGADLFNVDYGGFPVSYDIDAERVWPPADDIDETLTVVCDPLEVFGEFHTIVAWYGDGEEHCAKITIVAATVITPGSLVATPGPGHVFLQWDIDIPGEHTYNVYRRAVGQNEFEYLETLVTASAAGVVACGAGTFDIKVAINGMTGWEGGGDVVTDVTVTAPATVAPVESAAGDGQVTVTWQDADADVYRVYGYEHTGEGGLELLPDSPRETSACAPEVFGDLTAGRAYTFQVRPCWVYDDGQYVFEGAASDDSVALLKYLPDRAFDESSSPEPEVDDDLIDFWLGAYTANLDVTSADGVVEAQMVVGWRSETDYYYAGLSASSGNGKVCIGHHTGEGDGELGYLTEDVDGEFSLVTGQTARPYDVAVWVKLEPRYVEEWNGWVTYYDIYISLKVQYNDGGTVREGYLYASDCFSRDWPGVPLGIGVRADLTAVSFTDRRIETPQIVIMSGAADSGLPPDEDSYSAVASRIHVVGQTINYHMVNLSEGLSVTPVSWSVAAPWDDPQYATCTFDEPGQFGVGGEVDVGDGRSVIHRQHLCGYPPDQLVTVDVDIVGFSEDNNEEYVAEKDEEKGSRGACLSLNRGANHLRPIMIRHPGLLEGQVKVAGVSGNIELYEKADKTSRISSGKTYPVGNLPKRLYVEAVKASTAKAQEYVEVKYVTKDGETLEKGDKVKFTAFQVHITLRMNENMTISALQENQCQPMYLQMRGGNDQLGLLYYTEYGQFPYWYGAGVEIVGQITPDSLRSEDFAFYELFLRQNYDHHLWADSNLVENADDVEDDPDLPSQDVMPSATGRIYALDTPSSLPPDDLAQINARRERWVVWCTFKFSDEPKGCDCRQENYPFNCKHIRKRTLRPTSGHQVCSTQDKFYCFRDTLRQTGTGGEVPDKRDGESCTDGTYFREEARMEDARLDYGLKAPSIGGVEPAQGRRGTAVSITQLTGAAFVKTPTVQLNKGPDTITATNVQVATKNKITCTFAIPVDAALGSWSVKVTNPAVDDDGDGNKEPAKSSNVDRTFEVTE